MIHGDTTFAVLRGMTLTERVKHPARESMVVVFDFLICICFQSLLGIYPYFFVV